MVSVELHPVHGPQRVGYSGHDAGAQRKWLGVHKEGDRPMVFVARGSHAAYLDHMAKSHRSFRIDLDKGLPAPFNQLVDSLQKVVIRAVFFGGVRDRTAFQSEGVAVTPDLRVLPKAAPVDDPEWWWLNLNCRWGSSHTRIVGFTWPLPPWKKQKK